MTSEQKLKARQEPQKLPLRLILKFDEPEFEKSFLDHYTKNYLRFVQFGLGIGFILILGDFAVDLFAYPDVKANFLRILLALPIMAVGIWFSVTQSGKNHWQIGLAIFEVIIAICLFAVLASIDKQGGNGLTSWVGILNFAFVELYGFLILGVQFRYSLVSGLFVFLAFLSAIWLSSDLALDELSYRSYHVVTMFILATGIGWWREYVIRNDFSVRANLQAREAELTESYRLLREIEQRQMLAQERQRLVQDMHDGLGSSLVSALKVVEHGRMEEAEVAQVLKGCIDDLKLAIDSMEPVEADLLLLLATLRFRLGPRLESSGIVLRWEVENVPALEWLDPKNALHILRILQEAFSNIIKHTHATEIRVTTGVENNHVVVTVTDNGQGFSVENALKSGGKGLSNQMRRAQAIGAKVNWESNDAGTRLTLLLPIKRPQA